MLFEDVVDVLRAGDLAFANAIRSFVMPADRRTERDSVITNLAAAFQFLEHGPKSIVIDLLHPNVVQLQQVDMLCFEPLERGVGGAGDCFGGEILRNFALTSPARFTVMNKIIT